MFVLNKKISKLCFQIYLASVDVNFCHLIKSYLRLLKIRRNYLNRCWVYIDKLYKRCAEVLVKWSACSPSTPTD